MATSQQFMAPTMDVRVHGSIPEGTSDILTPEALRQDFMYPIFRIFLPVVFENTYLLRKTHTSTQAVCPISAPTQVHSF